MKITFKPSETTTLLFPNEEADLARFINVMLVCVNQTKPRVMCKPDSLMI